MGWWKMNESGGISETETRSLMGDDPADIMDKALGDIIVCYNNDLKRQPTEKELRGCMSFCLRKLELLKF
jgi:hypothetical protein